MFHYLLFGIFCSVARFEFHYVPVCLGHKRVGGLRTGSLRAGRSSTGSPRADMLGG